MRGRLTRVRGGRTVGGVTESQSQPASASSSVRRWGRRLGMAVFWFYLIKGLAWLVVFAFGGFIAANAVTGGS
jgi:hypothetical protein